MQIDDNNFHVVQTEGEDHIVQTEGEAIDLLQSDTVKVNGNRDSIAVISVTYEDEDWSIQSLPWQKIAMSLLE